MGKKLIIKGADFSANGIPSSETSVTDIICEDLYQSKLNTDGTRTDSTTRVSTTIVSLTDIGAEVGDKIVFLNPSGILVSISGGVSANNLSNESHWYSSDYGIYDYEQYLLGAEFTIPAGVAYIGLTFGKASEIHTAGANLSVSSIEGYIANGTLAIVVVKAE